MRSDTEAGCCITRGLAVEWIARLAYFHPELALILFEP
jgi:hypothetical protein